MAINLVNVAESTDNLRKAADKYNRDALAAGEFIEAWRCSGGSTPFAMLTDTANTLCDEASALLLVLAQGWRASEAGGEGNELESLKPAFKASALDGVRSLIEMAAMLRDIDDAGKRAASRITP